MGNKAEIPEPLYSFLRIECNSETFLLGDIAATQRKHPDSEYFKRLYTQMNDPKLLAVLSDPKLLESLTGYGFETALGAKTWLDRLRRYVFENGPPPSIRDIE